MRPTAEDFLAALRGRFKRTSRTGDRSLKVCSGDLHEEVGSYPGTDHRMPTCCRVMRDEMTQADKVLAARPSGQRGVARDPLLPATEPLTWPRCGTGAGQN